MIHGAVRGLLADVSEAEAFMTIGKSPNHICWQTGHIITTTALRIEALGEKAEVSREWKQLFYRGSKPDGKPASFPNFGQLRTRLLQLFDQFGTAIVACPEDLLDSELPQTEIGKQTVMNYLTFLLSHDLYHAGQIAIIRRHLGRPGLFD
jgi:uncharacterized damage-inducible protein DinB